MNRERLKKRRDTTASVPKQRRPKGMATPVSKEWKALVRRELTERGMTQSEFAELVHVTPGAVTRFFGAQPTCRFVDEIVKVLGVPRPEYADGRDSEVVADLRLLRSLSSTDFDDIASRIRARLQRLQK